MAKINYSYTLDFYTFKNYTFKSVIFKTSGKWLLGSSRHFRENFDFYTFKNYTFESVGVDRLHYLWLPKNKTFFGFWSTVCSERLRPSHSIEDSLLEATQVCVLCIKSLRLLLYSTYTEANRGQVQDQTIFPDPSSKIEILRLNEISCCCRKNLWHVHSKKLNEIKVLYRVTQ